MKNYKDRLWEDFIKYGVATEEELQLVTSINGYTKGTLEDILYVRTGYKDFRVWYKCEVNH